MKQKLSPGNMELDLITREEMEELLTGIVSGYLRPPQRVREPSGVKLDGSGNTAGSTGFTVYTVEAGMVFVLTRMEFFVDGYSAGAPFSAASGGIDIYVNGQWRDGYPFSAGLLLPGVYTESESRAVIAYGGQQITVDVAGGPASKGFSVNTCGLLAPLEPEL